MQWIIYNIARRICSLCRNVGASSPSMMVCSKPLRRKLHAGTDFIPNERHLFRKILIFQPRNTMITGAYFLEVQDRTAGAYCVNNSSLFISRIFPRVTPIYQGNLPHVNYSLLGATADRPMHVASFCFQCVQILFKTSISC